MSTEANGRVPRPALADSRRAAIADLLRDAGAVTVAELKERFGISAMTARRDLGDLNAEGSRGGLTVAR